jgi:hypothetical protein
VFWFSVLHVTSLEGGGDPFFRRFMLNQARDIAYSNEAVGHTGGSLPTGSPKPDRSQQRTQTKRILQRGVREGFLGFC